MLRYYEVAFTIQGDEGQGSFLCSSLEDCCRTVSLFHDYHNRMVIEYAKDNNLALDDDLIEFFKIDGIAIIPINPESLTEDMLMECISLSVKF